MTDQALLNSLCQTANVQLPPHRFVWPAPPAREISRSVAMESVGITGAV
ncbi:hypothetical protein [Bosea sp. 685]|nr:hypothetical protein [Bosea sp. 685]WNJ93029.1 hypothetical protein RMR04_12365 [Bosea sp. 685]